MESGLDLKTLMDDPTTAEIGIAAGVFRQAGLFSTVDSLCLAAYDYCQRPHGIPKGLACPVKGVGAAMKASRVSRQSLFSGRLAQLQLKVQAVATSIDPGKCEAILSKLKSPSDLGEAVGPIIVNFDIECAESMSMAPNTTFVRANKDAEVLCCCLCRFLCKENATVANAIDDVLNDLIFDGRFCGTGSAFTVYKMSLLEKEEESRDVIGASGARKCSLCLALVDQAKAEHRTDKCATDGDILMKVLKEDPRASSFRSWSLDTAKRWLMVGKRTNSPEIQRLLGLWEYHEKRNALVDSLSIMRATTQASQGK